MTTVVNTETIREVDEALRMEKERSTQRLISGSAATPNQDVLKSAQRIGVTLRYAGAASLIAASIVLLFQQWDGMDHVWRYISFLAFTFVTGAAGVFCGVKIGESKGARLLLAFVPGLACIHGAQLGALLYSIYGTPLKKYPYLLFWQAPSPEAAWGCVIAAGVVMIPLLYLAYSALERRIAKAATVACVIANSSLLLPFREASTAAVVGTVLAIVFMGLDFHAKRSFHAHTRETRLVIWSLSLPLAVLFGRQIFLYGISISFLSALLGFFAVLTASKSPIKTNPGLGILSYYVSLCLGTFAWILFLGDVHFFRNPPSYVWMAVGLPVAIGSIALGLLHEKAEKHFDTLAAILLVSASCFDLLRTGTGVNSALQLLCALSVLTWACLQERRLLLFIGASGVALGLYHHVAKALMAMTVSPWLILGVAGIATIVTASYLEKNFVYVQNSMRSVRKSIRGWQL